MDENQNNPQPSPPQAQTPPPAAPVTSPPSQTPDAAQPTPPQQSPSQPAPATAVDSLKPLRYLMIASVIEEGLFLLLGTAGLFMFTGEVEQALSSGSSGTNIFLRAGIEAFIALAFLAFTIYLYRRLKRNPRGTFYLFLIHAGVSIFRSFGFYFIGTIIGAATIFFASKNKQTLT